MMSGLSAFIISVYEDIVRNADKSISALLGELRFRSNPHAFTGSALSIVISLEESSESQGP